MTSPTVIPFARRERLLKKARAIMTRPDRFFEDPGPAVSALVRALPLADEDDKNTIIALLGSTNADAVVWPLYRIMTDASETEETRFHAAMQLSLTLAGVPDTTDIGRRLEADLAHPDPVFRRNAAVAYGWEGNLRATAFLMKMIRDGDPDVREDAVTALANLNLDSVLPHLRACYDAGGVDQKRVILYNLWRVTRQREAVIDWVIAALSEPDDGLRLDAMIVFSTLADPAGYTGVYRASLNDPSAMVRELSLRQLERLMPDLRQTVREDVMTLCDDPHPQIRVMARRFLMATDPQRR